jgi:hypothetical protein
VRSYFAGSASSNKLQHFAGNPATTAPSCTEYALAWRRQDAALDCGRRANHVWLGSDPAREIFGHPTSVPTSDPNRPDLTFTVEVGRAERTLTLRPGDATPRSLELPSSYSLDLTALADNPGALREVGIIGEGTRRCLSDDGSIASVAILHPTIYSTSTAGPGGSDYTRRLVLKHVDLDPRCPADTSGYLQYTFHATATNHHGVTVETPSVTVFSHEFPALLPDERRGGF